MNEESAESRAKVGQPQNRAQQVKTSKAGVLRVTRKTILYHIGRLTLREIEAVTLEAVLLQHEGCKKTTAIALGISRTALYMKMKRHGLLA